MKNNGEIWLKIEYNNSVIYLNFSIIEIYLHFVVIFVTNSLIHFQ